MAKEEDTIFDDLLQSVGDNGKFQKRFNVWFNLVLVIFATMPYMNVIIALSVPEHWCHVPGRELTNFTEQEWKLRTLPKETDTKGIESFSKCKMFNVSEDIITDCQHGWEFDKTWYEETAPSQQSWVCDKELYVTNSFVFCRIGDVVGTLLFGQLGDTFGRRPVFFATIIMITLGRCMTAFTSASYSWFLFAAFLGTLASTAVYQSPLVVAMEISRGEDRAFIAMLQCIGWTTGLCFMPLVMWFVGHWVDFMLITTLPCALFLFSGKHMIESPRWLASKGKSIKCIKVLKQIAETNETTVPDDALLKLRKLAGNSETVFGVMSLFSSWRLAKNSLLLIVCWMVTSLSYNVLVLNVGNLSGNPHLNFLWLGLAELPAYVIARYACDRIGRRWTHFSAYLVATMICIPLICIIDDPEMQTVALCLVVFVKFSICFCFYGVNLHAIETYPTCCRQTGVAVGMITANAIGICAPYIVYLGRAFDARWPYMILLPISVCGLLGSFLPETLYEKLPETLEAASHFGANQSYWSLPKRPEYEKPVTVHITKE